MKCIIMQWCQYREAKDASDTDYGICKGDKMDGYIRRIKRQLDVVDDQIVKLYEERMKICEQVGEYKVEAGRKVFDRVRRRVPA